MSQTELFELTERIVNLFLNLSLYTYTPGNMTQKIQLFSLALSYVTSNQSARRILFTAVL